MSPSRVQSGRPGDGSEGRQGEPAGHGPAERGRGLDGEGPGAEGTRVPQAALVDLLGRIAEGKGTTRAQIALAWLLAQKPWIVPIPGTRRLERLEENLGALRVELTSADLAAIDAMAAEITVHGDRYPEAMQRMIDR